MTYDTMSERSKDAPETRWDQIPKKHQPKKSVIKRSILFGLLFGAILVALHFSFVSWSNDEMTQAGLDIGEMVKVMASQEDLSEGVRMALEQGDEDVIKGLGVFWLINITALESKGDEEGAEAAFQESVSTLSPYELRWAMGVGYDSEGENKYNVLLGNGDVLNVKQCADSLNDKIKALTEKSREGRSAIPSLILIASVTAPMFGINNCPQLDDWGF
jgi:hypothetical protein